jgi:hypothetical protein
MPHVSDVRATSHDRHDPMLVAALAAGDLAATDRDQAIDLTRSCADCAALHGDLLVLARAVKSAPPPVATRPRDFRLTAADAARLRPTGWRRMIAALSGPRAALTRPLGVGLATLGLAGLLIGNVQLGVGSAAAPEAAMSAGGGQGAAAAAASGAPSPAATSALTDGGAVPAGVASAPAASGAPRSQPDRNGSAAPSTGDFAGNLDGVASSNAPEAVGAGPLVPSAGGSKTAAGQPAGDTLAGRESALPEPARPLNVLFGAALLVGIGLIVVPRLRGRRSA